MTESDLQKLLSRASNHQAGKEFDKTIEVFDQVLARDRDNKSALVGKTESLQAQSKFIEAEQGMPRPR